MTKESILRFADDLLSKSAFLQEKCPDIEEYRDPRGETPIALMGYFGRKIAQGYNAMLPDERKLILNFIEQGLLSDDEDVGIAVATGLIEGLIHTAEATAGEWEKIELDLGPEARAYADAYRNADFSLGADESQRA